MFDANLMLALQGAGGEVFASAWTGLALLTLLIFVAALLYSSVGHAGASGYIAAMALFSLAPEVMKPTALTLNVVVAALATWRWQRVGLINWPALMPLIAASVPLAFIGGSVQLPSHWYRTLVGIILLIAAAKLIVQPRSQRVSETVAAKVPWLGGALTGGLVGLLSGLTGTGGGIFLSPVLLFLGWAGPRQMSGMTAPFILVNSLAGLAGNVLALRSLPVELPLFMLAALLGGGIGTQLGISWASTLTLQRLLGLVLAIAGVKFLIV